MGSEPITGDNIFTCHQCGDCCRGFGGTYVTARDIIHISAYIHFNAEQFAARYCEKSGSRYVLACGNDGCCIFFDKERQCTIHPVKPYMCKAWPFIKTLIRNPENWSSMADSCPGIKKDISEDALKKIVRLEKEKLDKSIQK